ncbi:MAG: hypothetical protein UY07_C0049G0007 [Parcubacteria group bacterium GW2011_GWA1_47_8]|nr:MAG: hypothetical protein UY07_C0049G0007 [Parcubacteria group bacterium GW2011_GWA1_47_8]
MRKEHSNSNSMNWIKNNKANIALSMVSVIITLVAVDTTLYFSRYKYVISKQLYPRSYFAKDIEIGHDIAPNAATTTHFFEDSSYPVWSNNLGCFDTDYAGETPYLYMAGDSLTWGFSPFEEMWGTRVQALLGIRTVKCGVTGGYGTKQEFIKTSRNLARLPAPELIIVEHFSGNDIDEDANFPINTVYNGYLVPNLAKGGVTEEQAQEKYARFDAMCTTEPPAYPTIQRVRCFLSNHSVLYNFVKKDIRRAILSIFPQSILEKMDLIAHEKRVVVASSNTDYEKHLGNILEFKKLAKEKKAKLLFVLVPGEDERLLPFLKKEGISYLDLGPLFEKYSKVKPLHWKINGHWNIAGQNLAGFAVAKFIIENDLVDVARKEDVLKKINTDMEKEFVE